MRLREFVVDVKRRTRKPLRTYTLFVRAHNPVRAAELAAECVMSAGVYMHGRYRVNVMEVKPFDGEGVAVAKYHQGDLYYNAEMRSSGVVVDAIEKLNTYATCDPTFRDWK